MMKIAGFFAALILAILYYFFYYPPVVMKRQAAHALESFADVVETKDRAKISQALQDLLTDDAKIRLEVHFFSITQANNPPVVQDFDKESFVSFIDNTLYPLTDFAYYPDLKKFSLAEDRQSAGVTFSSREWADGANYYGGVSVNMRFSSDTVCEGTAAFAAESVKLRDAVCRMQFRAVPKPQDIEKMQNNADAMREYLTKP